MQSTTQRRPMPDRVPWDDTDGQPGLGSAFVRQWGRPRGRVSPENVTVYGKTGSGKTFWQREILRRRAAARGSHIVVVATKRDDDTVRGYGWPVINKWPPDYGKDQVVFWIPGGLDDDALEKQRQKIGALGSALWVPRSNRIVAWDELPYVCGELQKRQMISTFYREGRALGITNVANLQRPTDVPRYVHSETGWVVSFGAEDEDDRQRVAEVFGHRAYYRDVLADLNTQKREFLLQHKLTGKSYISHIPPRRTNVDAPTRATVARV